MKTLLNFLLGIPKALFGGFIFAQLWNWFVAAKFGLPTLNFLNAVGVLIVISFPLMSLTLADAVKDVRKEKNIDADTANLLMTVMTMVFVYPLIWGVSYVWHLVIG